jgi:glycosyltransferase involved in cell wall biosynthesis
MKLLVFAHTPPPHHGQSYMVKLMLDGFGGNQRGHHPAGAATNAAAGFGISCYHVNARLSRNLEDIGEFRLGKVLLLVGYCLQAIWCRFRYGVTTLYYVPSPGKRSALIRDWVAMWLCRPFFKKVVLHWHAAGLAKWLETSCQMRSRSLTYRLMRRVDLSIVLSRCNREDAEKLLPRQIRIVSNGIPDPCPNFESDVRPRGLARYAARCKLLAGQALTPADLEETGGDPCMVRVLYLAHCTREKGLFDALAGARLATERLDARGSPLSVQLVIAGNFVRSEEKLEFERLMANPELARTVRYAGFVDGPAKDRVLREADVFCFPTYYQNENQPVNLIEAMAFGLPVIASRWRSIPEILPPDYRGLVPPRAPEAVARALLELLADGPAESLRERFLKYFTVEQYLSGLAQAIHGIDQPAESPTRVPLPCAS